MPFPQRRVRQRHTGPAFIPRCVALLLWLALPLPPAVIAAHVDIPLVEAAPRLDGVLDDAAWERAAKLGPLTQASPRPGAPASTATDIRLLHDGRTLFVAVRAGEAAGHTRIQRQTRRDADLSGDDHLALVLDPAGAGRNGHVFRLNAIGAQADALVFDSGAERADWDAIWDARVHATDEGWTAELAIPLQALSGAGVRDWGLNVERYLAASGERQRWSGALPDRAVTSLRDAGRASGLPAAVSGLGLRLKPSLRLGERRDAHGRDTELEPGLDVFWRLRADTTATLTLNTDFAESEVDDRQVNLTRYPLFFPEKREFFLQDAGVFAFGGLGDSPLPFFSRRIGVTDDGLAQTLDAGIKLTHESRHGEAGLLATRVAGEAAHDDATVGVGRVALRAGEQGRLGAIGTVGNPQGTGGSRVWGLDWQYRDPQFLPDRSLGLDLWTQTSRNTDTGRGRAHGLSLDWDNLGPNGSLGLQRIDADYAPALGFVFETGIEEAYGELGWWHRTADGGDVVPQLDWGAKRGLDDARAHDYLNPEIHIGNAAGDYLLPELFFERETLVEDFEILPGLIIPAGRYRYDYAALYYGLAPHRLLSGEGAVRVGEFYDGHRQDYRFEGALRPGARFGLILRGEHTRLDLPAGNAAVNVAALGLDLTPSPRLAGSALAQWDDVSDQIGLNLRLRWTPAPGRDLYLTANRLFQRDDGFATQAREARLKIAWNFSW